MSVTFDEARNSGKLPKRFWRKVARPVNDTDCWIWTGGHHGFGHGRIVINWRRWPTHALVYHSFVAEIPDGICCCHHCDVPACVNPAHLFIGTRADNNNDKVAKGRASRMLGELHPQAILSDAQVAVIKSRLIHDKYRGIGTELAREYGVNKNTIYNIKSENCWRHIATINVEREPK